MEIKFTDIELRVIKTFVNDSAKIYKNIDDQAKLKATIEMNDFINTMIELDDKLKDIERFL